MRVLLLYPSLRKEIIGYGDLGAVAEPLALEYLAAGAELDGHDVRLLDLRLHPNDLDSTLTQYRPDVAALTGYSMHVLRNIAIAKRIKGLLPACRVVVGGHHATLLPEDFFLPQFDFVVRGEGVHPFRAILRGLERGIPETIPGVWARTGDEFVDGGNPLSYNIDQLPSPNRFIAGPDRQSYFIDWMKPIALLRTTVGCPYRCSFCSLWKIQDGRYHMRDVDRVVAEIASVQEQSIFLVDDEAFINGKRMTLLAQAIRAAGIRKRYFTYCRIDTLLRQPQLMAMWAEIGLERLFIGIEAVTANELKEYNKRLDVAQIENGLRAAKQLGIHVFGGFIVNTNYTKRCFKQLIRFIEHNRVDYPSFTVLTPLPGTEALDTFDAITERQPNGRPNWELFDLQHPVTQTALPKSVFEHEYQDLYRVFGGVYAPHRPSALTMVEAERTFQPAPPQPSCEFPILNA
ncbi:MAG: cobalamin-dependent protein [Acidobacteriaceae bacterium]|nr:cobalamin-dependent protein [Acidobacteriaceae bacterium]